MRDAGAERLRARLVREDLSPIEAARLAALVELLLDRPAPPEPADRYPRFEPLRAALVGSVRDGSGELIEDAFLELYCHLHGHEATYSPQERGIVDRSCGYWAHAGGLSPVLKAPDWIGPETVSADFGAGNGLQLLLVQALAPHRRSVQIEIAGDMIEAGRGLQAWLGIPHDRVTWRHADLTDVGPDDYDFIYLYRPLRPDGPGAAFYERFGRALAQHRRPVTIFSVADCLARFLPGEFERVYFDGHLTCYRRSQTRPGAQA